MSPTGYHLSISAPGIVDIQEETHTVSYNEGALRAAIANTKRTREQFADEEHYQAALKMFQDALRLLLENWS